MHLVKPLWLNHVGEKKDFEVYSCHVSPDGQRLVTAAGDGYVRIWSTKTIIHGENHDANAHKQLAALSYHTGTIHTVRFSPNGRFLASGADDRFVCIYVLDPNPPTHSTFGSNEAPPVENWRIFRRLSGHENDVQDLGWSCDSSILVSVGLDSKIVVWSGHNFEKLKTISQHGSHVKGITFDPANKFFATASDDRSIKVWQYTPPLANSTALDQTSNFGHVVTIEAPFSASPLTTYFRRCSWSPDGNHIAAANAVNGPLSVAAIIDRGTWNSGINLIGHENPIEVCAFSPRMFVKEPIGSANPQDLLSSSVSIIACAGQDKALTLWSTMSSKPIAVFEGLALKAISDLAWSPDGENLFITSLDGTIVLARFSSGELGYPLPADVTEPSLAKYGGGRKVGMVQGPDALLLEELSKSDDMKNAEGRMGELMGGSGETATFAKPSDAPKTNGHSATNGDKDVTMADGDSSAATKKPESEAAARVEKIKQRVTYTKDGKKRVAPLLLSTAAGSQQSSLPSTQLLSNSTAARNDAPQSMIDFSKPYDGFPKGGIASLLIGHKRKLAETGLDDDDAIKQRVQSAEAKKANAIMVNTADGLTPANPINVAEVKDLRPSLVTATVAASPIRLATPLIRLSIVRSLNVNAETKSEDAPTLEVRNPSKRYGRYHDREPARVAVSRQGQILWQDFLPKAVALVTGNNRWWAVGCEDGSIHTWTTAGRRLCNAFVLDSQAVLLDCRGPWLLVLTAIGTMHVFDIESGDAMYPAVSLSPVLEIAATTGGPHLTGGPGIVFGKLTSEGRVVVGMSNGEAFTYSNRLLVWQRLSEQWWAAGSQYWNTNTSASSMQISSNREVDAGENDMLKPENVAAGVIPYLERNTNSQGLLHGRAFQLQRLVKALLSAEGYEGFESTVSVAHLENRLAAALTLGAREEFKLYLGMYAKRIGSESMKLKIEELLRSLLAGVYDERKSATLIDGSTTYMDSSSDEICGWKKEVLLKEVVLILGKYRDLQRLTVPYARLLGIALQTKDPDGRAMES